MEFYKLTVSKNIPKAESKFGVHFAELCSQNLITMFQKKLGNSTGRE